MDRALFAMGVLAAGTWHAIITTRPARFVDSCVLLATKYLHQSGTAKRHYLEEPLTSVLLQHEVYWEKETGLDGQTELINYGSPLQ